MDHFPFFETLSSLSLVCGRAFSYLTSVEGKSHIELNHMTIYAINSAYIIKPYMYVYVYLNNKTQRIYQYVFLNSIGKDVLVFETFPEFTLYTTYLITCNPYQKMIITIIVRAS